MRFILASNVYALIMTVLGALIITAIVPELMSTSLLQNAAMVGIMFVGNLLSGMMTLAIAGGCYRIVDTFGW